MGANLATIHNYERGFASEMTSPSQRDWLTLHAELCGVTVLEVQRLWRRFLQLDDDVASHGCLHVFSIKSSLSSKYKDDVFMKNLLLSIARDDKVYFQTFVNLMRWADSASSKEKCVAMFSFFNQGNALGRALVGRLLKRVYPDKAESDLEKCVDTLITALDPRGRGEISEAKFMKFIDQFPQEDLDDILHFAIMPNALNEEAHRLLKTEWISQGTIANRDRRDDALVSDQSLEDLSSRLVHVDWIAYARNIGYTTDRLKKITDRYTDQLDQVNAMLQAWKKKLGALATCGKLNDSLAVSHPDLCSAVYG